MFGIGVGMVVVGKYVEFGKWFQLLSSLLMLGGIGIGTAGILSPLRQGALGSIIQSRNELRSREAKTLSTSQFPETLPSVTERTTQLIAGKEEDSKSTDPLQ